MPRTLRLSYFCKGTVWLELIRFCRAIQQMLPAPPMGHPKTHPCRPRANGRSLCAQLPMLHSNNPMQAGQKPEVGGVIRGTETEILPRSLLSVSICEGWGMGTVERAVSTGEGRAEGVLRWGGGLAP